jgi:hypothetical protein
VPTRAHGVVNDRVSITPEPGAQRKRHRRVQVTDRDLELLAFVAKHKFVLTSHVQVLLDVSAYTASARLLGLTHAGYIERERPLYMQPGCYRITRPGLKLIGSSLRRSQIDPGSFQHDVGLAWVWLAARTGAFGSVREVISERELRSHDGRPQGRADPLAVRLGGVGRSGRPRLHYPDLLLVNADGRRIALELELTTKDRPRREQILSGYAADRRIDAVVYLIDVGRRSVGRAIEASAARLRIADLVQIQHVRFFGSVPRGPTTLTLERAQLPARDAEAAR